MRLSMPLDQNQLGLLRRADRILEEAEKAEDDDADAAARVHEIVATCLENLHGVEVQCACHVFRSTALQRVLKHSNSSQRAALAAPLFSSPPRALLTDKYGSHAVEALLAAVLFALARNKSTPIVSESDVRRGCALQQRGAMHKHHALLGKRDDDDENDASFSTLALRPECRREIEH